MAALIAMREQIHDVLSTIDRYNPANLETFLHYIKATVYERGGERERERLI